jgi:hypothetical protein
MSVRQSRKGGGTNLRQILFLMTIVALLVGCAEETRIGGTQDFTYLLIADSTRAADASWSPDGSRLAYTTGTEIKYVTPPDTEGKTVVRAQSGLVVAPSWSPNDDARVGYVAIDSVGPTATIIESDTLGENLDTLFAYTAGQLMVGFVDPESLCLDLIRPRYGRRMYIGAVGNVPGVWEIDTSLVSITLLVQGRSPDIDANERYLAYSLANGGIRMRHMDSLSTDSVSASGFYPTWSPDDEQLSYACAETVNVWSRTTGQLRGTLMSESVSHLAWREYPHPYDVAMRIPSDGTVWCLNTLLLETTPGGYLPTKPSH